MYECGNETKECDKKSNSNNNVTWSSIFEDLPLVQ